MQQLVYSDILERKGGNFIQNLVYLIGRLSADPELKKSDTERNYTSITLAVQRAFKNSEGLYECDFIKCKLWNLVAQNVNEYCKKGDLVGVKGRIQIRNYKDDKTNEIKYITEIIADKVSFLTSKKTENY